MERRIKKTKRVRMGGRLWNAWSKCSELELYKAKVAAEAKLSSATRDIDDIVVRQSRAKDNIIHILARVDRNSDAAACLRNNSDNRVLGGWFGLSYRHTVQVQLDKLFAEQEELHRELAAACENGTLADPAVLLTSRCDNEHVENEFARVVAKAKRSAELESTVVVKQLAEIQGEISRRIRLENEKRVAADRQAKLDLMKAKAAAHDGKTRNLSDTVKRKLAEQSMCPYCGGSLGSTPHADHIYPVSRGGHSVVANMVFVCVGCNQKKGDKTLRAFARQYGLNRAAIERRLDALGKEY